MNALLRLAFSKVADPVLFNPLLALLGGIALLDIARRTFRCDAAASWVVLIVYALSAQMLINAMTVYSMTGHMALNPPHSRVTLWNTNASSSSAPLLSSCRWVSATLRSNSTRRPSGIRPSFRWKRSS